jgi:hypothetical protein
MRWSFSTDNSAPGGGPNAAAASGNQTAAMAAATIAANRMAKVRGDAGSREDMH